MGQIAFALESLALRYRNGGNLLGPWTFSLAQGRSGVLCGPSGSGKTSLLYCLAGRYPEGLGVPDVHGECVVTASSDLLLERSFLQVLGPTVRDELRASEAPSKLPPGSRKQELEWLLEAFSLALLWERPVRELSEGERQRVALASLLLRAPTLFLLDQPASSLDSGARAALKEAIQRVRGRGAALLLADPDWCGIAPADSEKLPMLPTSGLARGGSEADLSDAILKEGSATAEDQQEGTGARLHRSETAWGAGGEETLLEFEGLEIRRGGRTILRDISGKLPRGAIIALVGDNGSGKTSLLLALGGMLKPSRGRVRIPDSTSRRRGRHHRSLMLQEALWHLSGKTVARELQWVQQRVRQQPRPPEGALPAREGITPAHLVSLFGIPELLPRAGQLLSRGETQRVVLAMTALRSSPITFLDEPFRFLWDQERRAIVRFLRAAKSCGSSFLITSPVEFPLPWADQVWRLREGRMETCRSTSTCDHSAMPSSSVPCGVL